MSGPYAVRRRPLGLTAGALVGAVLMVTACTDGRRDLSALSAATGPSGVLSGQVTRGPLSPVGGLPGARGAEPVSGVTVVATAVDRPETRSALSDAQGNYRLVLAPGAYDVTMAGQLPPMAFTKSLPARVSIAAGQETRLDIFIDTGLR